MKTSAIGWTDFSGGDLNFVTGCTPVSEGCANCYAAAIYRRFDKPFNRVQTHPEKLARLAKARIGVPVCDGAGNAMYFSPKRYGCRPMCFVCDTGDLFHEDVPMAFVGGALGVMERRTDVVWQILTKRPERMRQYFTLFYDEQGAPENIWLGVTAENQETADERIPILLDTPAAVRFVSVEPMLEPIDMRQVVMPDGDHLGPRMHNWGCDAWIDWVICGAESGPDRRRFDLAWAIDLYHQCRAAGVPFFGKQTSGLRPGVPLELPGVGIVQEWPDGA